MRSDERCFACNRPMKSSKTLACTIDGQSVYVGEDCYAKIADSDTRGYQPPLGGPRLYVPSKI